MEPVRNADGKLVLNMPMADQPLSGIASEDIGRTALGIFRRGTDLVGETISIAGDHLTGDQYAAALTTALRDTLGEEITYQPLTWDEYRALQFYAEDSTRFTGDRDLTKVRELNPDVQSLKDWLTKHKTDFKLEPTL
jgi:hypothetical protein